MGQNPCGFIRYASVVWASLSRAAGVPGNLGAGSPYGAICRGRWCDLSTGIFSARQQHRRKVIRMGEATGFTLECRERFLALLAVGYSVEAAAAAAGTSRTTVSRWTARGETPGASLEHAAFAQRLATIRRAQAEKALAEEADALPATHPYSWVLDGDPFVAMSPEEMAMLTPEQQQHARQVTRAADRERRRERPGGGGRGA
jgi:hypothetical protein